MVRVLRRVQVMDWWMCLLGRVRGLTGEEMCLTVVQTRRQLSHVKQEGARQQHGGSNSSETASTTLTCPDLTLLLLLLDHALHLASLHYCSLLALIHSLLTRIFSGCLR
jgi:hypothetical protein